MVIDTGVFTEYLRAKDKLATTLYKISDNTELYISAVLYMGATKAEKERDVKLLTEDISVLPFTAEVATKAAKIYHLLNQKTN
ncbi:type II toxin-antitoxin system VapC family toxin [Mucilaginibacter sp. UC70_90]